MKILRKVGDKGQITIPKELRDLVDIKKGDVVQLELVAVYPSDEEDGHGPNGHQPDGAPRPLPESKPNAEAGAP